MFTSTIRCLTINKMSFRDKYQYLSSVWMKVTLQKRFIT